LPFNKRGSLVALSVEDHYVRIQTVKGEEMVLMRLGDAERELAGFAGLRVHRSHWVALAQVQAHARRSGRDFLQMSDGSEVPVSRSFRPAAQEAGLF
jgi:DNA-binding LytR/AlgR family response regulator